MTRSARRETLKLVGRLRRLPTFESKARSRRRGAHRWERYILPGRQDWPTRTNQHSDLSRHARSARRRSRRAPGISRRSCPTRWRLLYVEEHRPHGEDGLHDRGRDPLPPGQAPHRVDDAGRAAVVVGRPADRLVLYVWRAFLCASAQSFTAFPARVWIAGNPRRAGFWDAQRTPPARPAPRCCLRP